MAEEQNITINQGAEFILELIWKDSAGAIIPLTGYTAAMQIRETLDSEPIITLTTESGGIVIVGAEGKITVTIDGEDTKTFNFIKGIYDLFIIPSTGEANAAKFVKGQVVLDRAVTRIVV
jgi:hypothetical protein